MNDATRMADPATYDRAVQHFGQRRIALPTFAAVSYTHLRAHETVLDLVCRLLLEKKKYRENTPNTYTRTLI